MELPNGCLRYGRVVEVKTGDAIRLAGHMRDWP
jgi:hypothetical protein